MVDKCRDADEVEVLQGPSLYLVPKSIAAESRRNVEGMALFLQMDVLPVRKWFKPLGSQVRLEEKMAMQG